MDCQVARETLDAARPDRSDWDAPELRAAAGHVETCDECSAAVARQQEWDARLAEAFAAVEIPVDLRSRLRAAVAAASAESAPRPATEVRPDSRLRWLWFAVPAAVLLAVMGWQFRSRTTVALPLAEIYSQVDARLLSVEFASLPAFDGGFDSNPADPVWRDAVAAGSAKGLSLDAAPGDDAAAYRFAEGRVTGWLLVLPKSQVLAPPQETVPVHANFQYGVHSRVAWTAGESVYVCVLDAGVSPHEMLRAFYGTTA
jgi:hypothetical protein